MDKLQQAIELLNEQGAIPPGSPLLIYSLLTVEKPIQFFCGNSPVSVGLSHGQSLLKLRPPYTVKKQPPYFGPRPAAFLK